MTNSLIRIGIATTSTMMVLGAGIAVLPAAQAAPTPRCHGQTATIVGTAGSDNLVGTDGSDVIVGLGGDDSISSGPGDDVICGGRGADLIRLDPGDDVIDGGAVGPDGCNPDPDRLD